MPKKVKRSASSFGRRLAMFRRTAGYTQQELANTIHVSRRMIAYYESETEYPPTALIPKLTRTLRVGADELLGIVRVNTVPSLDSRILRRLERIGRLSRKNQEAFLRAINAFVNKVG